MCSRGWTRARVLVPHIENIYHWRGGKIVPSDFDTRCISRRSTSFQRFSRAMASDRFTSLYRPPFSFDRSNTAELASSAARSTCKHGERGSRMINETGRTD